MISPHELKNKEFSKSLRGYSTVEVDEHIDFIVEKYTELYRENDELEKKLRMTEAQLDALKAEEESIRSTLVNAQKASARIIDEANEQADVIMRSAKNSCDRLIAELKVTVKKENERLEKIKSEVAAFKAALFEGYQSHIELIESIAPDVPPDASASDLGEKQAEEFSRLVVERIRADLSGKKAVISGSDTPYAEEEETGDDLPGAEEEDAFSEGGSAELKIPDELLDEEEEAEPEEIPSAPIREEREPENAGEDQPEPLLLATERTTVESGAGVVDSIRRINRDLSPSGDDDDEEFLRMLNNVASGSDRDLSQADEFSMVYDGKKKK